ncbi:hypothetical protein ACW73L_00005, partial [Methylolobus aquaticus]
TDPAPSRFGSAGKVRGISERFFTILLGERYRHLLFGHYRAIFKTSGDRVIVLRVLHGPGCSILSY